MTDSKTKTSRSRSRKKVMNAYEIQRKKSYALSDETQELFLDRVRAFGSVTEACNFARVQSGVYMRMKKACLEFMETGSQPNFDDLPQDVVPDLDRWCEFFLTVAEVYEETKQGLIEQSLMPDSDRAGTMAWPRAIAILERRGNWSKDGSTGESENHVIEKDFRFL